MRKQQLAPIEGTQLSSRQETNLELLQMPVRVYVEL